jgi:predicted RecA/RadA family phage recombinase
MKNAIQPAADSIDFLAPSGGVVGGAGFLLGAIFGVVRHSAAEGEKSILDLKGIYTLPKTAANTPAPGAIVYWDDTAKSITTTVGSNVKAGIHAGLAAAAGGDATLPVRLNGVA